MVSNKKLIKDQFEIGSIIRELYQDKNVRESDDRQTSRKAQEKKRASVEIKSPSMEKLAHEYEISLKILNERISALNSTLSQLKAVSATPEKDPGIIEIKERLKPLIQMQTELKEIEKEVRNYYSRSWWRSPAYTCNGRGVKVMRVAPFVNNRSCDTVHPLFSVSFQTSKS